MIVPDEAEHTVQWWRNEAEKLIGDKTCIFLRNEQITSNYAQAYLRNPRLFKWAGMAAFASHHIRLALKPFALRGGKKGCIDASELYGPKLRKFQNLRILKEINDAIYNDIYWAHLAYDGSAQGLERIKGAIGDQKSYANLLGAFEKLDLARQLIDRDPNSVEGDELAWEANTEILWHEQVAMVQPRFEKIASSFSQVLSIFSSMHYQYGGRCKHLMLPGAFVIFMVSRHSWRVIRTGMTIANLDQRWEWIRDGILPGFRCYEEGQNRQSITRDLQKIVSTDSLGSQ